MEKKTRVDQTVDALTLFIKNNRMTIGDKLPNEYDLSTKLNVGRNTVREAVRVLASRNILVIKQGAGTFIADNTGIIDDPLGFSFADDQVKLVDDLMQLRVMVEPQIAALAAQNATQEDIDKLKRIGLQLEDAISKKDDFSSIDQDFHSLLSEICGNEVIAKLIPIITEGVSAYAMSVTQQEYEQTLVSHKKIIRAIEERKPKDAEQAMLYHLLYNINRK